MGSKPRMFPCNTCSITFKSSELQRSHMRQSWHIHNLRRRVAELPTVSEEDYDTQAQNEETVYRLKHKNEPRTTLSSSHTVQVESVPTSNDVNSKEVEIPAQIPSTQCLFCPFSSPSLTTNIDHMSIIHGLFIPSPGRLYDLDSFVGYLATIVFEHNECLYCGFAKGTVDSVQTHMRDKGHCMLNLHPGSELLDFWETEDIDGDEEEEEAETRTAAIKLSQTELRLPSGTIITARSDAAQLRNKPGLTHSRTKGSQYRCRKAANALAITEGEHEDTRDEPDTTSSSRNDRRIAARSEMGLVGVSEDQRRGLLVTEMKMKKREAIAKTAGRYAMEQQPVKTKYYKTEAPIYQAG